MELTAEKQSQLNVLTDFYNSMGGDKWNTAYLEYEEASTKYSMYVHSKFALLYALAVVGTLFNAFLILAGVGIVTQHGYNKSGGYIMICAGFVLMLIFLAWWIKCKKWNNRCDREVAHWTPIMKAYKEKLPHIYEQSTKALPFKYATPVFISTFSDYIVTNVAKDITDAIRYHENSEHNKAMMNKLNNISTATTISAVANVADTIHHW